MVAGRQVGLRDASEFACFFALVVGRPVWVRKGAWCSVVIALDLSKLPLCSLSAGEGGGWSPLFPVCAPATLCRSVGSSSCTVCPPKCRERCLSFFQRLFAAAPFLKLVDLVLTLLPFY